MHAFGWHCCAAHVVCQGAILGKSADDLARVEVGDESDDCGDVGGVECGFDETSRGGVALHGANHVLDVCVGGELGAGWRAGDDRREFCGDLVGRGFHHFLNFLCGVVVVRGWVGVERGGFVVGGNAGNVGACKRGNSNEANLEQTGGGDGYDAVGV